MLLGCASTRAIPSEVTVAPQSSSSAIVLTPAASESAWTPPRQFEERFGNTELFGTGSSHAPDLLLGSPLEIPRGGRLTHLGVISVGTDGNVMLALYADDGNGDPGRLIAWTREAKLTGHEMVLSVVREVDIPKGDYWIMGVFDVTASIGIDYGQGDAKVSYTALPFGQHPPDPYPLPPQKYQGQRFNYFVVFH